MSFVLSAGALAVLVRAHDCPNAGVETLYETFVSRSEDHISQGLVWYYCGGLGVSLFCLALIGWSHTHRKIPNQRIKKNFRLLFRIAVAIVMICLPLAPLDSLELVATTTALITCVLVLELVGSTCWGESFWWNTNCSRNKCTYSAKCGVKKEEIEKSLKDGTVVNVEEIARREAGENGSIGAVLWERSSGCTALSAGADLSTQLSLQFKTLWTRRKLSSGLQSRSRVEQYRA